MTQSQDFQHAARQHAINAAEKLRNAATRIEKAFDGDPHPSDAMYALEVLGEAMWTSQASLAHATHQHALAVLHKERERNT